MLRMLKTLRFVVVVAGYGMAAWRIWSEIEAGKRSGPADGSSVGTGV